MGVSTKLLDISNSYAPPAAAIAVRESQKIAAAFADFLESGPKAFTPLEQKKLRAEKESELLRDRVLEVGLQKYTEEQKEVEKLKKVLSLLEASGSGKFQGHIENFIQHFEDAPPRNTAEMYDYMRAYVSAIPKDNKTKLKEDLWDLVKKTNEMMRLSDAVLEDMRKAARKNSNLLL